METAQSRPGTTAQRFRHYLGGAKSPKEHEDRCGARAKKTGEAPGYDRKISHAVQRSEIGEDPIEKTTRGCEILVGKSIEVFTASHCCVTAQGEQLPASNRHHVRRRIREQNVEPMLREKGRIFTGTPTEFQNATALRKLLQQSGTDRAPLSGNTFPRAKAPVERCCRRIERMSSRTQYIHNPQSVRGN